MPHTSPTGHWSNRRRRSSTSWRSTTPPHTFSVAFAKAFATLDNVRVGPKPIRVGRPTDRAISSRTACAATTLPRPSGSTGSRKDRKSVVEGKGGALRVDRGGRRFIKKKEKQT